MTPDTKKRLARGMRELADLLVPPKRGIEYIDATTALPDPGPWTVVIVRDADGRITE